MFLALSLIALGYGFKVYVEATDLKNVKRRQFGRIVGIYIMAVAFAASGSYIAKYANNNGGACTMMAKMCPMKAGS